MFEGGNSKEYSKIKKGELALRSIFIIWYSYFPTGDPTGKVFWNEKEYPMCNRKNDILRNL
tara:strand:- start:35 stop:217 length:183 start_codon:yes stop_codon:yes gene_type:complete